MKRTSEAFDFEYEPTVIVYGCNCVARLGEKIDEFGRSAC